MSDIRLAVISDLHVGLAARSKDLCPQSIACKPKDRVRYNNKAESAYRKQFVDFVTQNKISADYLVLPGDVTNRAHPEEVKLASEFINEASAALCIPPGRVIFVPGNHDVDWSVYDPKDNTGFRWTQRYDALKHPQYCFHQILASGKGDVFTHPHFLVWEFNDLLAVGYNSCSHDKPVPESGIHHGLADPAHMVELKTFLQGIDTSHSRLRLFLVHHHPIDFAGPQPGTPEFSLMTNAEQLLAIAHEFEFDILVHGHRHHPRFETHSTQTYPHLPVLCAGSFSVDLDTQWAGTIDNQFHLITVTGRGGSENRILGQVTSWSKNRARGWVPSEQSTSGIHHNIPFGSYVMPGELDARLAPLINQLLAKKNYVLWSDVVQAFGDLKHLPLDSAIAAFRRASKRLRRETMHETLKDLILY